MKGSLTYLARILVLKEEEVRQYMSHYGGSGVYGESALVVSARAGFQIFASMVLWFLGGDAQKQLDERPTRFSARLWNAFLNIDPNTGIALGGVAYALGTLERNAPDFCVVYYLLLLEAAMDGLFKQGLEDDMITVVQESASFQTVDYMLCQLKTAGVRYDGDLKRDLEIGLIRAKGVAALLRTGSRLAGFNTCKPPYLGGQSCSCVEATRVMQMVGMHKDRLRRSMATADLRDSGCVKAPVQQRRGQAKNRPVENFPELEAQFSVIIIQMSEWSSSDHPAGQDSSRLPNENESNGLANRASSLNSTDAIDLTTTCMTAGTSSPPSRRPRLSLDTKTLLAVQPENNMTGTLLMPQSKLGANEITTADAEDWLKSWSDDSASQHTQKQPAVSTTHANIPAKAARCSTVFFVSGNKHVIYQINANCFKSFLQNLEKKTSKYKSRYNSNARLVVSHVKTGHQKPWTCAVDDDNEFLEAHESTIGSPVFVASYDDCVGIFSHFSSPSPRPLPPPPTGGFHEAQRATRSSLGSSSGVEVSDDED
ncbi:uncharacterized protein PV09_08057 [Verruconis gallopava]|uniref:Uncharacterized protein n=1 Tax=Verruconis gallopava TaxID=253628 RepID=A0A0D2AMI1_9PEZI|nr:uncharacterized protein PV09_08057 [Verruconis gallopava]KIW00344.1 hypothetical protein PV09_08057 [Verruconis gallopava]